MCVCLRRVVTRPVSSKAVVAKRSVATRNPVSSPSPKASSSSGPGSSVTQSVSPSQWQPWQECLARAAMTGVTSGDACKRNRQRRRTGKRPMDLVNRKRINYGIIVCICRGGGVGDKSFHTLSASILFRYHRILFNYSPPSAVAKEGAGSIVKVIMKSRSTSYIN